MPAEFPRPVRFPTAAFDGMLAGEDPAVLSRVAHESAQGLLGRVRAESDPAVLDRLVGYVDEHGIDALAELWAGSPSSSLPGVLWRISLLHALIRQDPEGISLVYRRGVERLRGIEPVVAGAAAPTGPEEILRVADEILRGVFAGDFAVALERAEAFCRLAAAGSAAIADDADIAAPEDAGRFTENSLRFSALGAEFGTGARLWRAGALD